MDEIEPFTEAQIGNIKRLHRAEPPPVGSADWFVARWIATVDQARKCSDCNEDMYICPHCDKFRRDQH